MAAVVAAREAAWVFVAGRGLAVTVFADAFLFGDAFLSVAFFDDAIFSDAFFAGPFFSDAFGATRLAAARLPAGVFATACFAAARLAVVAFAVVAFAVVAFAVVAFAVVAFAVVRFAVTAFRGFTPTVGAAAGPRLAPGFGFVATTRSAGLAVSRGFAAGATCGFAFVPALGFTVAFGVAFVTYGTGTSAAGGAFGVAPRRRAVAGAAGTRGADTPAAGSIDTCSARRSTAGGGLFWVLGRRSATRLAVQSGSVVREIFGVEVNPPPRHCQRSPKHC